MPITGSVGALTYSRSSLDNSEYWALIITGAISSATTIAIDYSTERIFSMGGNSYTQITGFTNPIITTFDSLSVSNVSISTGIDSYYDSTANAFISVGTSLAPSNGFPNYTTTNSSRIIIDSAGDELQFYYPFEGASPSANNQMRAGFTSTLKTSTGDYYASGSDTSWLGGTNFQSSPFLYRFSSADAYVASSVLQGPSITISGQGFVLETKLQLMSNEDPVIAFEDLLTGDNNDRVIIQRRSNTTTVGPDPATRYQALIWTIGLQLTGVDLYLAGMQVDSSDNVYVLVNRELTGNATLVKLNSSGVIQWQKNIPSILMNDLAIDSSGNIYAYGRIYGSFRLWIGKFDTSGNVIYQRRILLSGTGELQPLRILHNDSELYLTATAGNTGMSGNYAFYSRIKDDGSIAGTFAFVSSLFGSITYDSQTFTIANGTLTSFTPPTVNVAYAARTLQQRFPSTTALNKSKIRTFLS